MAMASTANTLIQYVLQETVLQEKMVVVLISYTKQLLKEKMYLVLEMYLYKMAFQLYQKDGPITQQESQKLFLTSIAL